MPDLNFFDSMKAEHCSRYGHNVPFTSANYGITTTPRHEWLLILEPGKTKPEKDSNEMRFNRIIPNIYDLEKTELAVKAKLSLPEVIALVLY